ncbi:MAG TPA: response regulator [Anaeromyxobacteraceae bacterium]|nr:response regulator [Anaeromyxobacteraceae bacterium]
MDDYTNARRMSLLLVEDNPGDVDLVAEAVREFNCDVSVASDGVEAMEFLRREGRHAGARRPDLVLLDLNLPKLSGREVLERVKEDPALKHVPIVILSSSHAERDLMDAYRLHANCFVTKPVDLDQFLAAVGAVAQFWLGVVKLPSAAATW